MISNKQQSADRPPAATTAAKASRLLAGVAAYRTARRLAQHVSPAFPAGAKPGTAAAALTD
ncbi:hypothetical protein D8B20_08405 [Candidatus Pantoea soli]|uniref:Uncharacterized protein n=1 Tax=Candidatus Pantoea soli TaxID=3098669 RepID=A0A518XCL3_9GAMM|nr:hypothetical protein D8B20_08405 [Pantoea soli]